MINSFAELKKNRSSSIEQLQEQFDNLKKRGFEKTNDPRFWQPTPDKDGTGYATIRFLPAPAGENLVAALMYSYSWEGPSGCWYINDDPTTIDLASPINEHFRPLWKADKERAKKEAPRRQTKYIGNIFVIDDPKNPEANGKVWLFKYGTKIFDKLKDKQSPKFPGVKAINPFCPWEGANFNLRFHLKDGFRNYDPSEFDPPSPLGEEKFIEKVWNEEYSLVEFRSPDYFKSYDELSKDLQRALGTLPRGSRSNTEVEEEMEDNPPFTPTKFNKTSSKNFSVEEDDEPNAFLERMKRLAAGK